MRSIIPRRCYSEKKKAPARKPTNSRPEWGSTKIHGFPGFGSKDLSNPRNDKTANDAMVNIYRLECPKPIILLNNIEKSRKSVETDDDGPGGH